MKLFWIGYALGFLTPMLIVACIILKWIGEDGDARGKKGPAVWPPVIQRK